ncbi:heme uptake protein IsdC [Metasolibacillus meyeri]|uniref:Heme uptake protein IsdC n=1 Tax=Metasolibacillus meyeri TaxID=1071052 RepID=A0AAW9NMY5_9BACL|nr:heme uptake protein IsdC [Metasolibacillus meyeri]MEC1178785.1 heme uptake protein IsdC [Metasolibacillus meyeri]
MKKLFLSLFVLMLGAFILAPNYSHAQLADGTYNIPYQVNKPSSISASMANDYFLKPAQVIVKNGKATVQLTIKNSAWVTEFNPPGGATVISQNAGADTRVVQFAVANLSNPVTVAMKIDIDDINYHHGYSVDFVFDATSIPQAKEQNTQANTESSKVVNNTSKTQNASNAGSNGNKADESVSVNEQVENPQTSDSLPHLFIFMLIASALVFYKVRQKN